MISKRINLIPYPWQVVERIRFGRRLILGFWLCLAVIVWLHFSQLTQIRKYRAEVEDCHSTQDEVKHKEVELEKLKSDLNLILSRKDGLKKRVELVEEIKAEKVDWNELLRKLTFLIPERVWLSELSISQVGPDKEDESEANLRSVNIAGSSLENESISKFVTALEHSPEFTQVSVNHVTKKDIENSNISDFEISLKFKAVQK